MKTPLALVLLLVTCLLFSFALVRTALAGSTTIYIRYDGKIDPSTPLISTLDNTTYTINGDLTDVGIYVQRDNIIIDGNGHLVEGEGSLDSTNGFRLHQRNNVTIKNATIKAFDYGIELYNATEISIIGNNVTDCSDGIHLELSNNCNISNNNVANNGFFGILCFNASCSNTISKNTVTNNGWVGLVCSWSSNNNVVYANNFIDNDPNVRLWISASGNKFYHNNFVTNGTQVHVATTVQCINTWDDGYPSGGNYWNDYNATDSNVDGIADYDRVFDASNHDQYPLMGMFHGFDTTWNNSVDTISNSSISNFNFELMNPSEASLTFNITGENGTQGFCRIRIPKALINGSYVVKFNGEIITNTTHLQVRELSCSNEANEYLYINYAHSEHEIEISGTTPVPEFPSFLILPLFMIMTLTTVIAYRKRQKRLDQWSRANGFRIDM